MVEPGTSKPTARGTLRTLFPAIALLGLLPACASDLESTGWAGIGPHGGVLVALPGEAGFAEIALESPNPANGQVQVIAYFHDSAMEGALNPLPTEVAVQIEFPDRDPALTKLSQRSDLDDQVAGGPFTSKPGPFAVEPLRGTLSGVLAGQPFTSRFKSPR